MRAAINWQTIERLERAGKMLEFVLANGCVTVQEIAQATGFSEALVGCRMKEFCQAGTLERHRPGGKLANSGNRPDLWFAPGCGPALEEKVSAAEAVAEADIEALFHGRKSGPAVQLDMPRHWMDVALFGERRVA